MKKIKNHCHFRQKPSEMTPNWTTVRGFTLIELLVVVLIIGILAAIALPQYNKAVTKSRLAAIKPVLSAVKSAEEMYYLEHGSYTQYTQSLADTLDIGFSCRTVQDGSVLKCDDYFLIDVLRPAENDVRAAYCPGHQTHWNDDCVMHYDFRYIIYLDHSSKPGKTECSARTALGRAICKSEGF